MAGILEIISKKRDGLRLEAGEIGNIVNGYVRGEVAHEQMSAFLMAVVLRGLDPAETAALCQSYVDSGSTLHYPGLCKPTTDKHSTGGVGDKITLILTPMVMAMGAAVPQLSGRGLGHTGGTLDKLESIHGFTSTLSQTQMESQLRSVGGFICAASPDLAPADRLIYALRDVTGTVPSIPLIAASIMSKKIAEGTESLVLDVKVGKGAFMATENEARELSNTMLDIGRHARMNTRVVLSRMDEPLGYTAGNALEVAEALEVLAGGGPRDIIELCTVLAVEMLEAAGMPTDGVESVLGSGKALRAFEELVKAQGGDLDKPMRGAYIVEHILAETGGYIEEIDAMEVAMAAWKLGAGRVRKEDFVDHSAGVVWTKKSGEYVRAGEKLIELHTSSEDRLRAGMEHAKRAIKISSTAPEARPLVLDILR